MKCDKCGKPSVYHSKLIVNGVSKTTNLCHDCAVNEGALQAEQRNIFDDMFSAFSDFLPFEKVADIECPVCKMTLKQFKLSNLLGCPFCYEAFREEIGRIVNRIEPFTTHKQDKAAKIIDKTSSEPKDKIVLLREMMAEAVKAERYEDAAKIKKQIQKLEAEK